MAEETIKVYGVGREGKDVTVEDAFTIHVPYGYCYEWLPDERNTSIEMRTFRIYTLPEMPPNYRDGMFETDMEYCSNSWLYVNTKADVSETLKKMPDKRGLIYFNWAFKASFYGETASSSNINFLGDDSLLIAYTTLKLESNYSFYVLTEKFLFTGSFFAGLFMSDTESKKHMLKLIKSIKPLKENKRALASKSFTASKKQPAKKTTKKAKATPAKDISAQKFVLPKYTEQNKVTLGPLTVTLPDGCAYLTCEEEEKYANNEELKALWEEYVFVAATDCEADALANYRKAPLGINMPKIAPMDGISDMVWEHADMSINISANGKKAKWLQQGDHFKIGYISNYKSSGDDAPFGTVIVLCGVYQICFNLFSNYKKTTAQNYNKTLEEFCAGIEIDWQKLEEIEFNQNRETLDVLAGANGRIDAIAVTQLYSKDIVFNNDDELIYDGKHTIMRGLQLNALKSEEVQWLHDMGEVFEREISSLIWFVEKNEKLRIPKSKVYPCILDANKGNPLTGTAVFQLCAWHMLMFLEKQDNSYSVAVDTKLVMGMPDVINYIGEIIRTLRAYNDKYDDFEVEFQGMINLDGPCTIDKKPVSGSVIDDFRGGGFLTRQFKGGSNAKRSAKSINGVAPKQSEAEILAEKIDKLKAKIVKQEDVLTKAQKNEKAHQKKQTELENDIAEQKKVLTEKRQQLRDVLADLKTTEQEQNQISAEAKNANKELASIKTKITRLYKSIDTVNEYAKNNLTTTEQTIKFTQSQLKQAEYENKKLLKEEEKRKINAETAILFKNKKTENYKRAVANRNEKEKEIVEYQEQLAQANQRLIEIKNAAKEDTEKYKEKIGLAIQEKTRNETKKNELQRALTALKKKFKNLEEQKTAANTEIDAAQDKLQALSTKKAKAEQESATIEAAVEKAKADIEKSNKQLEKLEKKQTALNEKNTDSA